MFFKLIKKPEWVKSKFISKFHIQADWVWKTKSISVLDKFKELIK
ncbi:MAG: hypothetical protein BAJALOKI3v1_30057 [Promethearchaeota archaeon]|nr:MAG: hypothetical protein BAJALOKI3v1_30057 [Candidatus Lokiarchaeota archaeon]